MAQVSSNQIIRTSRVGTFQEDIVSRIHRYLDTAVRCNGMAPVLNQLERLLSQAFRDSQSRPREDCGVLFQDGGRYIKACWFCDCQVEDSSLKSIRFQSRRDDDVRIENQPIGQHQRFGFPRRASLMIRSIWRDVSLSVPFRRDSSPRRRNTSGSGAASLMYSRIPSRTARGVPRFSIKRDFPSSTWRSNLPKFARARSADTTAEPFLLMSTVPITLYFAEPNCTL